MGVWLLAKIGQLRRRWRRKAEKRRKPRRSEKDDEEDRAASTGNCWSTLPRDLMREIFKRLFYKDLLCAVAVCKGWNIPIPECTKFPVWVVATHCTCTKTNLVLCESEFLEPHNPEPYRFNNIIDLAAPEFRNFGLRASVLEFNFGWLLGEVRLKDRDDQIYDSFFLCSPFTNKSVILPPLHDKSGLGVLMTTFSTHPTSLDCLVFVLHKDTYHIGGTELCTWQNGQPAWKTHMISHSEGFVSILYNDGLLYLVDRRGTLVIFNPRVGVYKIHSFPLSSRPWNIKSQSPKLVCTSSGQLLLVCRLGSGFVVYKRHFSGSLHTWVRKERLADQLVFYCSSSSRSLSVPANASELCMLMANRVYYRPSRLSVVSLEDGGHYSAPQIYCLPPDKRKFPYKQAWFTVLPFFESSN